MRIKPTLAVLCTAAFSGTAIGAFATPVTSRISTGTGQTQANAHSGGVSLSADGAFAAFISIATNLVPGDTNSANDVFVRGLQTGIITRASTGTAGAQADSGCDDWDAPALSADGGIVAFASGASNLVPGVANGKTQIYVHNMTTGATVCASVGSDGAPGDGNSFAPSISADGLAVAFSSYAANLTPGDTGATVDVFVHQMETGATTIVSIAVDGAAADDDSGYASISANGRCVAFTSDASNLVPNDSNSATDVFVRDLQTGVTAIASRASDGTQGNDWSDYAPAISADGSTVAFLSNASNLVESDTNSAPDVFVHDMRTGLTARASVSTGRTEANDASFAPSINASGRYVTFASNATNLTLGDTNASADVFVRDVWLSGTAKVSLATDGTSGNGWSGPFFPPSISADGRTVAFESWATNLVAGDTNDSGDAFARGPLFGAPPLSAADAAAGLRAIGGLEVLTGALKTKLNIDRAGVSANVLDILDAVRIARIAAGLE